MSAEAKQRPYYADYCPLRLYIHTLCTSNYLDLFITFIICVNVFTMSIEHYNQPQVRLTLMRVHFCQQPRTLRQRRDVQASIFYYLDSS